MKNKKARALLVKTRNTIEHDIPRLQAMVSALALHHGDHPKIESEVLRRDIFGEFPWIYVVVAEVDDEVIGYAALCPLIKLQIGIRAIDMHHLFVEEEFRGKGVGKSLITSSMKRARELHCKYMMVGTHPKNAAAQAFYLACGFEARPGNGPRFRITLE